MNKNFKTYALIWAIILVAFSAIVFVVPIEKNSNFYIAYGFTSAAFLIQLACAYVAFNAKNKERLFLNIPLIRISNTGLVLTFITSIVFIAVKELPIWIGAIIWIAIIAFTLISVIKVNAAADVVERVETKTNNKISVMKNLTVDAQSIVNRAKNESIKSECRKVYEKLRYSDPVSSSELESIEKQIENRLIMFSDAVDKSNEEKVKEISEELINLIDNRNNKCRILK